MKSRIKHETRAAAGEKRMKDGSYMPVGNIVTPAIYSTVPPPTRPRVRFYMERLSCEHGVWVKAERSMQKEMGTMLNNAKALPDMLRVVVLDWKDTPTPLDARKAKIVQAGKVQCIRPEKGARLLPLTLEQAQELPVIAKARKISEALKVLRKPKPAAKKLAPKRVNVRPAIEPIARPFNAAAHELREMLQRSVRGNTAMARALAEAVAR